MPAVACRTSSARPALLPAAGRVLRAADEGGWQWDGGITALRDNWKSQLGFIIVTAGSAIGLGNVWRFPTVVATGGGGIFLVAFVILVLVVGVPVLMGEMAVGRHTARGPIGAYRLLAPSTRWPWLGHLGALINVLNLSFYCGIAGACLAYAVRYIGAVFHWTPPVTGPAPGAAAAPVLEPGGAVAWLAVFIALTAAITLRGIRKGLERTATILMPVLFLLLLILAVRVVLMQEAQEGLIWLFTPRWSDFSVSTFFAALSQVFFSLSIGSGIVITYASYLQRDGTDLPRSALWVAGSDFAVGILAALVIIPALFAFDRPIVSGPELVFGTLIGVFAEMPLGQLLGFFFFLMLSIAALTSSVSMLEVPVTALQDERGWSRSRGAIGVSAVSFLLGVPSALSMAGLPAFTAAGYPFIVAIDLLTNAWLLPLSGLLSVVFIGWVWGSGRAEAELRHGAARFRSGGLWQFAIRYIVPVAVAGVLLGSLFG